MQAEKKIGLLKELGTVMGAKEKLAQEIEKLKEREQELLCLLRATENDRIADIRDAIEDVLKGLRNRQEIWIPPRRVISLVADRIPGALSSEIAQQLKALAKLKGSNVTHNGQRGQGSAYFYVGLTQ